MDQLDGQSDGFGQSLQFGVEAWRAGDHAHPLCARSVPVWMVGMIDGRRHHGEEDDRHHPKHPAPQPLPDLAPGHEAGVTREPRCPAVAPMGAYRRTG